MVHKSVQLLYAVEGLLMASSGALDGRERREHARDLLLNGRTTHSRNDGGSRLLPARSVAGQVAVPARLHWWQHMPPGQWAPPDGERVAGSERCDLAPVPAAGWAPGLLSRMCLVAWPRPLCACTPAADARSPPASFRCRRRSRFPWECADGGE